MQKKYPIFLSSKPKSEDKFDGGSHNKLAEVISETIKEDTLEKKVIGLEGEWGSGKSQVIELIQSKLGDNHYTFVFDAWGSQEDLTRKSFLEQLINRLFDKKFLNDSKKWKDLENVLLSKTSKKHKQTFPKIKSFWIFISLGIVLLSFLPSFYEYVLMDKDIFPFSVGVKAKPFLAIYALPIVFLFIGFIMIIVNYFEDRNWFPKFIDFEINIFELSSENKAVFESIEQSYWDSCKPLFGKRSGL